MDKKPSFWQYKFEDWSRDFTSLANPLILVFVPFAVMGFQTLFYKLLIALLINEILGSVIKIIFPKKRPNGQTYSNLVEKIDAGSFPSLHSSRITLVYLSLFSFADVLSLKLVFLAVILVVMLSRVQLKKHFWTDIIGGFIIGGLIWYISTNFF